MTPFRKVRAARDALVARAADLVVVLACAVESRTRPRRDASPSVDRTPEGASPSARPDPDPSRPEDADPDADAPARGDERSRAAADASTTTR